MHNEACTLQPMMLMMARSGLAEGIYGTRTYKINHQKDAFSEDPTYSDYYQKRPLGVAGNFHVVAFDTAELGVHTNGSILARKLVAKTNFGTNGFTNELSYIQEYIGVNGGSASMEGHYLVIGSNNTVTTEDNNNALAVNGTKIDKPYHIIQDADTENAPFIDIDRVEREVTGISARLVNYGKSKSAEGTVVADFTDMNNRTLTIQDANAACYYNTTAKAIHELGTSGGPVTIQGFVTGCVGTMIINVDCTGYSGTLEMPSALMSIDGVTQNTSEVTNFANGKILWNFVNAEGITIVAKSMSGSILALGANVESTGSLNGTVICENFHNTTESHRTDFTGTFIPPSYTETERGYIVLEKTDADNSSLMLSGATFKLYRLNDNDSLSLVDTGTSDSRGLILFDELDYNVTYALQEIVAPEGYKLNDSLFYFRLRNPSDVITGGNTEEIYKEYIGGKLVHYVLQGGSVNVVNSVAESIKTSLTVRKVNENNEPLPGASFKLVVNGNEVEPVVEGNSVFNYGTLTPNSIYEFTEIAAPNGYKLPDGKIVFQTDGNGNIIDLEKQDDYAVLMSDGEVDQNNFRIVFTLRNECEAPKFELPETGSVGTTIYTAGSILLLAIAFLMYIRSRYERRRDAL